MYETLLLSQTAEPPILPLPLCFKAWAKRWLLCALVTLSRFAHWFERAAMEMQSVPQYFSDPLALTFWGDTEGACGGMQVRMMMMTCLRWM